MISSAERRVLIVEDNIQDYESIAGELSSAICTSNIYRAENGEAALGLLKAKLELNEPIPNIILLSLKESDIPGMDFLKKIKTNLSFKMIPVIILASSDSAESVSECYIHGANGYIVKPVGHDRIQKITKAINKFWLSIVHLPKVG